VASRTLNSSIFMSASMFALDLLARRTAFVTGASSGIGRHCAALFARHGAVVVAASRRDSELASLVADIEAGGGRACRVSLDVRDPASVAQAIESAGRLASVPDVVVNNAGVALTRPAVDTGEEEWQRVLDTNLSGAFRVARAAAQAQAATGKGGSIINVASILAFRVAKQVPAYVAAKAGLVKLTEALALELAPLGIRVNAIAPGYIDTDINREFLRSPRGEAMAKRIPLRRFGTPEDLDGALLLLASAAGRYMTGTTITVDGGHGLAWL
jgi:NAD(P)-dependent dehydrogenase (short-subunit alcohol dehydrogenase family)